MQAISCTHLAFESYNIRYDCNNQVIFFGGKKRTQQRVKESLVFFKIEKEKKIHLMNDNHYDKVHITFLFLILYIDTPTNL